MAESWKQYDSEASCDVLKRITRHKEDGLELLKAAKDSGNFHRHIRSLINGEGGRPHDGRECPKFERMDENCFKNLSWKVHGQTLWEAMSDMPPIDACRPGLWLYVTLHAIETGAIESHYLAAAVNGSQDTGLSAIDLALNNPDEMIGGGKQKAPRWKFYSRLILRRMFGAISERGTKGIFVDVPFAKIWWQRRIAEDIAAGANIPADDMTTFFSEKDLKGVYEELTRCMASNLTVIADQPVRDGLMHFFFHAAKDDSKSPKDFAATSKGFKKLVSRLGVMLAWRAMGALDALENSGITYGCAAEIGRGEFS